MSKPFNDPKFKILQKKWYRKLLKEGFKDIEDTNLPEPPLKVWDNFRFNKCDATVRDNKERYFSAAADLYREHSFNSKLEKRIWKLHSMGHSVRKITKIIKGAIQKSQVANLIGKIAREIK